MIDMNKLDELLTRLQIAVTAPAFDTEIKRRAIDAAHIAIMIYVRDNTRREPHASFDEAAARAGKPVQFQNGKDTWINAAFVGMTSVGRAVVECDDGTLTCAAPADLRMAVPMMRTLYLNIGTHHVAVYRTEAEAKTHAANGTIHIAYPVEVPE